MEDLYEIYGGDIDEFTASLLDSYESWLTPLEELTSVQPKRKNSSSRIRIC